MDEKEFWRVVRDVVCSEEYRQQKHYQHHIKGSVYDHCLKTAWLCWQHHRQFGSDMDLESFVRGALLHDYYLYDWHDCPKRSHRLRHGFSHPRHALNNASRNYPDLTPMEEDMILRHMFPLTPVPPRTKAGWLLCLYDKIAALSDYFGENRWKKKKRKRKHIRITRRR